MTSNASKSRARRRRFRRRVEAYCMAALVLALTGLALLASIGAARSDTRPGRPSATATVTTDIEPASAPSCGRPASAK
ncbi:hypothetical protein AB0G49_14215 [Streptomyces longwoodensis]|uniref:hypothetical protein n=1 Tax=Streptomyces longwoodensis TaxID=68231 RepID=UPI0033DDB6B0